ncbi:layilin isoform X6 [Rattus norvegicus]|uniref:layilin isoform X6 n=1 Tax=Rattus norvegicus TaxID=10116 RepID=UPI0003D0F7E8|nr:layilin isoform X5 [Rattus norvegicus]|eukprot:XP_006243114.1 PREDICTED: layilin isoform X3 [Rattus norvegicus]
MVISGLASRGWRRNSTTAQPARTFTLGQMEACHSSGTGIWMSLPVRARSAWSCTISHQHLRASGAHICSSGMTTGATRRRISFANILTINQVQHPLLVLETSEHVWTTAPSFKFSSPCVSLSGEATEPAAPILPEETLEIDTKERREAALNLAYILIPSIPLFLLLVVTSAVCWVWICRRKREQTDPPTKEQHTIWPTPHQENSPDLEVYNVIRKQSEADLAEPRPDLKNISFRVCSGEAMPDDTSCDYDNMVINPSESGLVTLASMEGRFVTNDIYEFSPDRMGRSKESGWVENEIYY